MRRVLVLGATGSIGTTCLDYFRSHPGQFELAGATAAGSVEKLHSISEEFHAPVLLTPQVESSGLKEFILRTAPDIVLNAVSGAYGLYCTDAAIDCGVDIALANKESVVMGGSWILEKARKKGVSIIPVDSEHSAIYNLLSSRSASALVITASGGPFVDRRNLENVSVEEALKHPTWKMGRKITVDSATLANKGLEVIEASYLFSFPASCIEVSVHRQSIVHSLIRTAEGAIYAQLSPPDMTLPIVSALSNGTVAVTNAVRPLSFSDLTLTFEKPDMERFPMLRLAYEALETGGGAPTAYNASDEVAVEAFLAGRIGFMDIPRIVEAVISSPSFSAPVVDYKSTMECDRMARMAAKAELDG